MEFINAIYGAEENGSRIRRVNVNLAPLSVEGFRRLKERNIGTFQLFRKLPSADLRQGSPCRAQEGP